MDEILSSIWEVIFYLISGIMYHLENLISVNCIIGCAETGPILRNDNRLYL